MPWKASDYDSLMMFSDFADAHPQLYEGLDIDEATQEALLDWFFWRKVADNDRFERFYRRLIAKHQWQYNQYLRIQSVEFDPMVASYLERWINRVGTTKSTTSLSGSDDRTVNLIDTHTGTSSETPNLTHTTEGTTHSESDDTSTKDGTVDVTGTTSNKGTNTTTVESKDRSLKGVLPDSSAYNEGGTGGFPLVLNWTYADSQDETDGYNNTIGNTTDTSENTGKTIDKGTVSNTGTTDGTSTITSRDSGSTDRTENMEIKHTGTDGSKTQRSGSEDAQTQSTDKEIATGRAEAPQDMLDRARGYVEKTNAFEWLVRKLEDAFMGVLEM